jgi:hypothetical protein
MLAPSYFAKVAAVSHGRGVVANTLNGARENRCDIDGKAKGRMSGSEWVNLYRNGAARRVSSFTLVGFIGWLDLGPVTRAFCVGKARR